jgi:hypothetical protein
LLSDIAIAIIAIPTMMHDIESNLLPLTTKPNSSSDARKTPIKTAYPPSRQNPKVAEMKMLTATQTNTAITLKTETNKEFPKVLKTFEVASGVGFEVASGGSFEVGFCAVLVGEAALGVASESTFAVASGGSFDVAFGEVSLLFIKGHFTPLKVHLVLAFGVGEPLWLANWGIWGAIPLLKGCRFAKGAHAVKFPSREGWISCLTGQERRGGLKCATGKII